MKISRNETSENEISENEISENKEFLITHPADRIYLLKDPAGCISTLVIGGERALLWDTGCGAGNLKKAVEALTTLPLLVIISHGHFDHIGGSVQFERVYLDAKDRNILDAYSDEQLDRWIREMTPGCPGESVHFRSGQWAHVRALDFDRFDLGGLACRVIALPGHSEGSVGVWIPDLKLLLSGDALTPIMCLIFLNHGTKETQIRTLEKVEQLEFDYFLTSHSEKLFPKALIRRMIGCIRRSTGKKHYRYRYPGPPYSEGWFYLDSIEEEPVGIIVGEDPAGTAGKERTDSVAKEE